MALTEVLKTGPSASAVFTPIGTEDASASSSTFSPMLVRSPTSHECLPAARPVLSRPGRCMWAVHWTQATLLPLLLMEMAGSGAQSVAGAYGPAANRQ